MNRSIRLLTEAAVTAVGAVLILCGALVSQSWIQHHFLPHFAMSPGGRITREILARVLLFALGVMIVWSARRVRRLTTRADLRNVFARTTRISIAILLALGTSEVLLRTLTTRAFDELCCGREPLRQHDAVLGWQPASNRAGRITAAGRDVDYVFDAGGARVRSLDTPTDPDAPTILFAGESVMLGVRLSWDESIPGQVAALSGLQVANFAVDGYSNAQAYLRLSRELPRFRKPVAVVFLFLPSVFYKTLDRSRPRLDTALRWVPPDPPWRLKRLAHWLAPYDSTAAIDEGVETSRAILRAVADLASARGAIALTLVPQFVPADPGERIVREKVLDDAGLPYLLVELHDEWRVPSDRHPDARANRAMADAIMTELERQDRVRPKPQREEVTRGIYTP
jgi:hypothetical protein